MTDLTALQKMVDDAQAALKAAGVEAPGQAQFAATTDHAVESPAEAEFAALTETADDAVTGVEEVSQAVSDVSTGHVSEAVALAPDLLSEVHSMVSDIHATIEGIKPVIAELAPLAEKLGNNPLFKSLGL